MIIGVLGVVVIIAVIIVPLVIFLMFFISRKNIPKWVKFILIYFLSFLLLCGSIGVIYLVTALTGVKEVISMGGTTATLITTGNLKATDSTESNSPSLGGPSRGATIASFDGSKYLINLGQIPAGQKTTLPSGYYQTGKDLPRAQALLIIQEICARPEINIRPELLAGFWYSESTAYIGVDNIVTQLWESDNDPYDGPFQHGVSAWSSTGANRGRAYISSIEDPDLPDDKRVQEASECTATIEGQKRPNILCFSDAAYTTALRLSSAYHGGDFDYAGLTKEIESWGESMGYSEAEKDILKVNSSCAYYNGYTDSQKTYIPAFYVDIYKANGNLDQWYSLASSRGNLNNKLKDLAANTPRVTPNWKNDSKASYQVEMNNGNWESSQFTFMVYNGGKWVMTGLNALGDALCKQGMATQTAGTGSVNLSTQLQKVLEYCAKQKDKSSFEVDGGTDSSLNSCLTYCRAAYQYAGITITQRYTYAYEAKQAFMLESVTKTSDGKTDWSKIPIGAIVFSYGSGGKDNYPGHVSIYIGNGKISEAGNSKVQEVPIDNTCGGTIYGWGWLGAAPSQIVYGSTQSAGGSGAFNGMSIVDKVKALMGNAYDGRTSLCSKWITKGTADSLVTTVTVKLRDTNGVLQDKKFTVNKAVAEDVKAIFAEIAQTDQRFKLDYCAAYNYRGMAGNGGTISAHSFGGAFDLNWDDNPFTTGPNKTSEYSFNSNSEVVQIFKAHGWYWGGEWSNTKDYMHFTLTNN